jgi:hypothetical protein
MTDDEAADLSAVERREYFRIRDQVVLDYQPLDAAEAALVAEEIQRDMPDRFTVVSRFEASSRIMNRLTHTFASKMPDLARYLKSMDDKLNYMARLFVMEAIDLHERIPQVVTLSGGGICFGVDREYTEDTLLELRIVLLPSMTGILSVGKVVHCQQAFPGLSGSPWNIAVEYRDIREPDRDLLVKHIMNRQTEELRRQRYPDEE